MMTSASPKNRTTASKTSVALILGFLLLFLATTHLGKGQPNGTFDSSWYLSTIPPSTSAIVNGVLETNQSNPNATDYNGSYYDTAQIGSFPWKGPPTTQPITENTITVNLAFQNRTLLSGSRYQIYVGLYYYLQNGTIHGCNTTLDNQGCHDYRWLDTEVRLAENINGTDTSLGQEDTYDAHDSFGYDIVLGQLQPGDQGNLTNFNIEKQFEKAATNWNIGLATPHLLMGVEVGTSGYSFQQLALSWYSVKLTNVTQSAEPSGPPTSSPPSPQPEQQTSCLLCQITIYVQSHLLLVVLGVLAGFALPLSIQLLGRNRRGKK